MNPEELLGKLDNIKKEIKRVEKGLVDDPVGKDYIDPEVRIKTKFTEYVKKEMRQLKYAADLIGRKVTELRTRLVNQQNVMKFMIDIKASGTTRLLGLAYLTGDNDAIARNKSRVVGKGNQHEELRKRQRQDMLEDVDSIIKRNEEFNKGFDRARRKEEAFNKLELNKNYLLEQINQGKDLAFLDELNAFDFNKPSQIKVKKLKVWLTTAYAIVSIKNQPKRTKRKIRVFLMRKFIKNYENYDMHLKETMFRIVRVPYLALLNFDDVDLDLSNQNRGENIAKKIFLKLETRLNSFLDTLIDGTNQVTIGSDLQDYIKYLTLKGSYVPSVFFSHFELSRIELNENFIGNCNENQRKMLIVMYLFIRIIVKFIFVDQNFSKTKELPLQTGKNFKFFATILYNYAMFYCRSIAQTVKKIDNIFLYHKKNCYPVEKKVEAYYNEKTELHRIKKFALAVQKWAKGQINEDENNLLKVINNMIPTEKEDVHQHTVYWIDKDLYKDTDMKLFSSLAKKTGFNFNTKFKFWVEKTSAIIYGKQ